MPEPRVLILYNEPILPVGHPERAAEEDVLYSVKVVGDSLTALDIPFDQFGVTDDLPALLARLSRRDFDVALNLYEGTGERSVTEVYFTGVLEWLGVSYTGCPSLCLSLARNKPLAKRLFASCGIPTPEFLIVDSVDLPPLPFGFPAIVKPACEDASVGIDQGSIVTNPRELANRVQMILHQYGPPALVERYIPGREIQVTLVDLAGTGEVVVLPLAEIAFQPSNQPNRWPVYTYTAKWHEDSDEYQKAPVRVAVTVPESVQAQLEAISKAAYRLLGARDHARVDTRVTPNGDVYVLELNPNPAITSVMLDEGLPATGTTYDQFIRAMVRNAWSRGSGLGSRPLIS